jgi:hypothetical protein
VRFGKALEAEFAPHKIAHHRFFLYFYARQAELGALEDHAEERIGVGLCRTQLLCLNRCLTKTLLITAILRTQHGASKWHMSAQI